MSNNIDNNTIIEIPNNNIKEVNSSKSISKKSTNIDITSSKDKEENTNGNKRKGKKTKKYNTSVDWMAVQQEYIQSDITIPEIAVKYDVDINTVRKHCGKEKWIKKREEFREEFTRLVSQRKAEFLSGKEIEVNMAMYVTYNKALRIANEILDNPEIHLMYKGAYSVDKLEKLTRSMNNIQNGQMLAVGIVPAPELKKLDLMQKKLELDAAKIETPEVVQNTSFIDALDSVTPTVWDDDKN